MRDMKRAFDERNMPKQDPAPLDHSADIAAVKTLADHALLTAIAAGEEAKAAAEALRTQMAALCAQVELLAQQHAAMPASVPAPQPQPTVRNITIQHGPDGRISGATVTEG